MKENYYACYIFIFFAFFWYSAQSQPFPVGDDFVVWDCDGEGFIQPINILPIPIGINSVQSIWDSVGYIYPSDSVYTDFKFVLKFEDSLGNLLTIHHPIIGATTSYSVLYELKSLPSDVSHTDDFTKKTLAFRLDAQYTKPTSGSFINVIFEVWGRNDKNGNSYRLLQGQTSDSYYKRDLSCSQSTTPPPKHVMKKNKRIGNFDQNVWIGPNPFQEYIYIETNFEESILSIRDMQGRLIREEILLPSEKRLKIKVGDLPAGLYFIQKRGLSTTQTIKMIKSR